MGTGRECWNDDLGVRRGNMPRPFPSYFFGQHGPLGQHCIVKTQHFGPRVWLASCAEAWVPRKGSAPNQQNPPAVVPSTNATTKIAFANMTASRLWGESILDGHGEKQNPATPPLSDHSAGRSRDIPSWLLSAQRICPLTQIQHEVLREQSSSARFEGFRGDFRKQGTGARWVGLWSRGGSLLRGRVRDRLGSRMPDFSVRRAVIAPFEQWSPRVVRQSPPERYHGSCKGLPDSSWAR